jgi:hypothetical protein
MGKDDLVIGVSGEVLGVEFPGGGECKTEVTD